MAWLLFAILFLLGSTALTAYSVAMHRFGLIESKKEFARRPKFYFLPRLLKRFFPKEEWENLFFVISMSKQICRLCYGILGFFYLSSLDQLESVFSLLGFGSLLILIALSLLFDLGTRLLAKGAPKFCLRFSNPFATVFLLLFFPLTALLLKVQRLFFPRYREETERGPKLERKILELVHETEMGEELSVSEQKLICSVATFKDRIVREVMVPRVDIFSLPADLTIADAGSDLIKEGYSRIPIYKDSVDEIVGVLHYKDLLETFLDPKTFGPPDQIPLEKLIKPILYTPETKRISQLLQEFRSKQIHMAIVVDEYGGTEGIVSIEDILEELVGEIADEFDTDEEIPFTPHPEKGYIVDAKMSLLDIKRDLGIQIPLGPDYDTLGGYIVQSCGLIPEKGFKIHHDNFDLEVQSADERSIDKVRITPRKSA